MKKVLLSLFVMMISVATFAGNPLKVISSNVELKTFMKEQASANLVIDWKNAQYDNRKSAAAEFNEDDDYAFIQKDCAEKFIEGFNAKSKGIKLEQGKKDADYKFAITITNLDTFINVMGWGPRTEAKMWGNLKITDAKGSVVAEIEIDEAEDGTDYIRREAFGKTFLLLGQKVAKLK
ncbi:MAG: hypothetical protein J6T78_08135 [Bacteroidaceae bacterium]|nr:hypothetical protein [Bacteroidaceae bacterium]